MYKISKLIRVALVIYVFLPFLLFIIGWLKWWISISVCVAFVICLIKNIHNDKYMNIDKIVGWYKLIPIVIIILLWVYISGIGGMVFQNRDHVCRNAMFNILVNDEWPVINELDLGNGLEKRGMIYYIGFWLPAAVVGKIFGLTAGYLFQMLWAAIGITLVLILLFEHFGVVSHKIVFAFIFFSGLDIVGCILLGVDLGQLSNFMHIEWWSGYQFSSHTTQLFWVFNQAIYAWIIILLIMKQKTNRIIILIWSCGILTCTLPFVGMLPFVLYKIIENIVYNYKTGESNIVKSNKLSLNKIKVGFIELCRKSELFTYENIVIGGCIGIISSLYVVGNVSASKSGTSFHHTKGSLFLYVIFALVEIGVYAFAMYKYQYKNPLYWLCIFVLMLCPWIHVGGGPDFCMRASIPALLILLVLLMETWQKAKEKQDNLSVAIVLILFLLGAVTPICEIGRTTKNTVQLYHDGETIMVEPVTYEEIMGAPNFSGKIDQNFFFEYMVK